jgi:hypothetical protein
MIEELEGNKTYTIYSRLGEWRATVTSSYTDSVLLENMNGHWLINIHDIYDVDQDKIFLKSYSLKGLEDFVKHLLNGRKFKAIKNLRMAAPTLGLKEAKYVCDVLDRLHLDDPNYNILPPFGDFFKTPFNSKEDAVRELCAAAPSLSVALSNMIISLLPHIQQIEEQIKDLNTRSNRFDNLDKAIQQAKLEIVYELIGVLK